MGMGEAPTAAVKVGWGVAGNRAVGDGGTSTGTEQLARVSNIRTGKKICSFIFILSIKNWRDCRQ